MRKLLVDARYHLARGFMEVYPTIFPEHDTLSLYEAENIVNWRVFAGNLNSLSHSFLKSESPPSCLSPSGPARVPASLAGESRKGQIDVATLKHHFEFFIPVFIWNFNKCKRDLTQLDSAIFEHRTSTLSKYEKGLRYYQSKKGDTNPTPPTPPQVQPPNVENRFKLGTALNLRKSHPLPSSRDTALKGKSRKDDEEQMGIPPLFRHPETEWFFSDITNNRTQFHPYPSRVRGYENTPSSTAAPRGYSNPRVRSPTRRGRIVTTSIHAGINSSSRAATATRSLPEGKYTYFCLKRNIVSDQVVIPHALSMSVSCRPKRDSIPGYSL